MIIHLKENFNEEVVQNLLNKFSSMNLNGYIVKNNVLVYGLQSIDFSEAELSQIEYVQEDNSDHVLVSRDFQREDTVIKTKHTNTKKPNFLIISKLQFTGDVDAMSEKAELAEQGNANILYFEMHSNNVDEFNANLGLINDICKKHHLDSMVNIDFPQQVDYLAGNVDFIAVDENQATNPDILAAVGRQGLSNVVILKDFNSNYEGFLRNAEIVAESGNMNIILAGSGRYQDTQNINEAIDMPLETHLPVIADISHEDVQHIFPMNRAQIATGLRGMVVDMEHMTEVDYLELSRQALKLNETTSNW